MKKFGLFFILVEIPKKYDSVLLLLDSLEEVKQVLVELFAGIWFELSSVAKKGPLLAKNCHWFGAFCRVFAWFIYSDDVYHAVLLCS